MPDQQSQTLIAVPHAGREYPADIASRARSGVRGMRALEDRYADVLAGQAVAAGCCAIVARRGRAILDLNRHVAEIDHASVADIPHDAPLRASAKLRGGLGLVPHRYQGIGELWMRRVTYAEVAGRVAAIHVPYHGRIAALLTDMRALRGSAILIDLHSMPSVRPSAGKARMDVVIGDRFGQSAAPHVVARAVDLIETHGLRVAVNHPYSGGYTLERHGRPEANIHAIQIEIDRALYLDPDLERPGAGVDRISRMVAHLASGLGDIGNDELSFAAE